MPLAEKGVRGKGVAALVPAQHTEAVVTKWTENNRREGPAGITKRERVRIILLRQP
jgi:hypothetical protein